MPDDEPLPYDVAVKRCWKYFDVTVILVVVVGLECSLTAVIYALSPSINERELSIGVPCDVAANETFCFVESENWNHTIPTGYTGRPFADLDHKTFVSVGVLASFLDAVFSQVPYIAIIASKPATDLIKPGRSRYMPHLYPQMLCFVIYLLCFVGWIFPANELLSASSDPKIVNRQNEHKTIPLKLPLMLCEYFYFGHAAVLWCAMIVWYFVLAYSWWKNNRAMLRSLLVRIAVVVVSLICAVLPYVILAEWVRNLTVETGNTRVKAGDEYVDVCDVVAPNSFAIHMNSNNFGYDCYRGTPFVDMSVGEMVKMAAVASLLTSAITECVVFFSHFEHFHSTDESISKEDKSHLKIAHILSVTLYTLLLPFVFLLADDLVGNPIQPSLMNRRGFSSSLTPFVPLEVTFGAIALFGHAYSLVMYPIISFVGLMRDGWVTLRALLRGDEGMKRKTNDPTSEIQMESAEDNSGTVDEEEEC